MFGKHKQGRNTTAASKFVMAQGRKVGNIQPPMKKDPSTATKAAERVSSPRTKMGAMGDLRKSLK